MKLTIELDSPEELAFVARALKRRREKAKPMNHVEAYAWLHEHPGKMLRDEDGASWKIARAGDLPQFTNQDGLCLTRQDPSLPSESTYTVAP